MDVDYEYGTDELYDDYAIHEPAARLGVYPQQTDDGADYHDYPEQGNYAEEHLAFLSEQGLDLADDDVRRRPTLPGRVVRKRGTVP